MQFTKKMKKNRTILLPEMMEYHFRLLKASFIRAGYKMEILDYKGKDIKKYGLMYVHNDMCSPAIFIIGQLICALRDGIYKEDEIAFLIPQAGGACRASNYYAKLKIALSEAGYDIPVISLNIGGEKMPGFSLSIPLCLNMVRGVCLSEALMNYYLSIHPFEALKGETFRYMDKYYSLFENEIIDGKLSKKKMVFYLKQMACDFKNIKTIKRDIPRIGITGEVYIKNCHLGNNNIEEFLDNNNCAYTMIGFTNYAIFTAYNMINELTLRFRFKLIKPLLQKVFKMLIRYQGYVIKYNGDFANKIPSFYELKSYNRLLDFNTTTGDGWLIASESIYFLENGINNVLIIHPFTCMISHIVEKGIIHKLNGLYPNRVIGNVEYDYGISSVNQENRLLLFISLAKEGRDV